MCHNEGTNQQTSLVSCVFCPQAVQQSLSHLCPLASGRTDREEDGRREPELKLQTQKAEGESERGRRRGVGVNEGGRHNCCYPRWIHTTNEGGTDFTQSAAETGSRVPKGDGNTGTEGEKRADDP